MKEFTATNSKVIHRVWYNSETSILSIRFTDKNIEYYKKTGRVRKDLQPKAYLYVGVTTRVFNNFKKSKSKGKFFAKNIRDNYPSQKDVFIENLQSTLKSNAKKARGILSGITKV